MPYSEVVKGALRANLEARVLLGHCRADVSRMTLDCDLGEQLAPNTPRGRATVRLGGYHEVQCGWLDPGAVDRWVPRRRLHAAPAQDEDVSA